MGSKISYFAAFSRATGRFLASLYANRGPQSCCHHLFVRVTRRVRMWDALAIASMGFSHPTSVTSVSIFGVKLTVMPNALATIPKAINRGVPVWGI